MTSKTTDYSRRRLRLKVKTVMILQQYRHGKRRMLGTSLYIFTLSIYILPFFLFTTKTTACRDYFYFTYYTRGHVGM